MNFDSPLYACFVQPGICRQLFALGLSPHVPYHYRINSDLAELNTYAFDKDDVYAQSDANVDALVKSEILPAYTLKDLEKMIPGHYVLGYGEGGYEVLTESLYNIPQQKSERMPDAFALVVLAGLKSRVMNVIYCNKILELNKPTMAK